MLFKDVEHKFKASEHKFKGDEHEFKVRKYKNYFERETFVGQKRNICWAEENLLQDVEGKKVGKK